VLAIGCEARYGATGRITYDLIAGLVIAVTAGLMFVPAFRAVLGLAAEVDRVALGPPGFRAVGNGRTGSRNRRKTAHPARVGIRRNTGEPLVAGRADTPPPSTPKHRSR